MEKSDFSFRLRKYRTDRNFTAAQLAELADISEHHIRNMESGSRAPTLLTLIKIANALNIAPNLLLSDANPTESNLLDMLSVKRETLTFRQTVLAKAVVEVLVDSLTNKKSETKLIGMRIQESREKRGLSQKKLAEAIGVSTVHLGNMETGTIKINIERLELICKKLDVSVNTLLSDVAEQSVIIHLDEILKTSEQSLSPDDYTFVKNICEYVFTNFKDNEQV